LEVVREPLRSNEDRKERPVDTGNEVIVANPLDAPRHGQYGQAAAPRSVDLCIDAVSRSAAQCVDHDDDAANMLLGERISFEFAFVDEGTCDSVRCAHRPVGSQRADAFYAESADADSE